MSEEEKLRLGELQRALADDPGRKAEVEEARARRIAELDSLANEIFQYLSDEACDDLENQFKKREITRNAAEAARKAFAAGSELKGLGTEDWRILWESARRYSETHAYSSEPFPVIRQGALCVLCQQLLSQGASVRLHSFEEFVKSDVQQRADEAKAELANTVAAIRSLSFPSSVRTVLRDAGLLQTVVGEAFCRLIVQARLRRRVLLRKADGKSVGLRPALPERPDLTVLRKGVKDEVERLRLATLAEKRLEMERQYAELQAREKLAPHFETIEAEIARLRAAEQIDGALADCNTRFVTLKDLSPESWT